MKTLELVAGQAAEDQPPGSILEGLGRIRLELHRLEGELSRFDEEQEAERLLEALVGLASAAAIMAEEFVLPSIEGGAEQ